MKSLLTHENITLALSIFGSLGTIFTLIHSFVTKRPNIKVTIDGLVYRSQEQRLIANIIFENHSRLPITITNVMLKFDDNTIYPADYPVLISQYQFTIKDFVDHIQTYNTKLPFCINQLDAIGTYLVFEIPKSSVQNLSIPLTFEVHTSRRLIKEIVLCTHPRICNLESHNKSPSA